MTRPKTTTPLATKLAQAFATVGRMQRRGKNTQRGYDYMFASDLFDALRGQLFRKGVLILPDEGEPVYVAIAESNGGEQITECRLPVAYTFMEADSKIGPYRVNGIARTPDEKCLYIAQIGSRKALLEAVGLIAKEDADPEFSGRYDVATSDAAAETDGAQEMRDREAAKRPCAAKTVTPPQISAFNDACDRTGKSQDEVSGYLLTTHQAVPHQGSLPLPTPAPPEITLKIGNKTVPVPSEAKGSYAL
jgi:hypothetical protein